MAIKDVGLPMSVFQTWSGGKRKRSTGDWVTENIDAHWNRYNARGITWASVVHIARKNGYKPRFFAKPQRKRREGFYEARSKRRKYGNKR